MFGDVVLDVPKKKFEHIFDGIKEREKVKFDYELQPEALKEIIAEYKKLVRKETGKDFPQGPLDQLVQARDAVFRSWQNDRAKTYRRINHIDDWLGTAVNVQAMVFGNLGESSAPALASRVIRDRRARLLRRIPDERPGRGRGLRRSHAAVDQRA